MKAYRFIALATGLLALMPNSAYAAIRKQPIGGRGYRLPTPPGPDDPLRLGFVPEEQGFLNPVYVQPWGQAQHLVRPNNFANQQPVHPNPPPPPPPPAPSPRPRLPAPPFNPRVPLRPPVLQPPVIPRGTHPSQIVSHGPPNWPRHPRVIMNQVRQRFPNLQIIPIGQGPLPVRPRHALPPPNLAVRNPVPDVRGVGHGAGPPRGALRGPPPRRGPQ